MPNVLSLRDLVFRSEIEHKLLNHLCKFYGVYSNILGVRKFRPCSVVYREVKLKQKLKQAGQLANILTFPLFD